MKVIPAHIARLLSQEDRQKYLPGTSVGSERQEQGKFAAWLKTQWSAGLLWYIWQRTDKKATGTIGQPDFGVFLGGGRSYLVEFKAPGGELTPPQRATLALLEGLGHSWAICQSAAEAIGLITRALEW